MNNIWLGLKLARRELRGGTRGRWQNARTHWHARKRADQGVCDIAPTMCEGSSVLNYAYGSVHTLQQLLQQKEPLSPCHPSIVSPPRPPSTTRSRFIALHMPCAS